MFPNCKPFLAYWKHFHFFKDFTVPLLKAFVFYSIFVHSKDGIHLRFTYFFNSSNSHKLMVAVMIVKDDICDIFFFNFFVTCRRESSAVCRRVN